MRHRTKAQQKHLNLNKLGSNDDETMNIHMHIKFHVCRCFLSCVTSGTNKLGRRRPPKPICVCLKCDLYCFPVTRSLQWNGFICLIISSFIHESIHASIYQLICSASSGFSVLHHSTVPHSDQQMSPLNCGLKSFEQ